MAKGFLRPMWCFFFLVCSLSGIDFSFVFDVHIGEVVCNVISNMNNQDTQICQNMAYSDLEFVQIKIELRKFSILH